MTTENKIDKKWFCSAELFYGKECREYSQHELGGWGRNVSLSRKSLESPPQSMLRACWYGDSWQSPRPSRKIWLIRGECVQVPCLAQWGEERVLGGLPQHMHTRRCWFSFSRDSVRRSTSPSCDKNRQNKDTRVRSFWTEEGRCFWRVQAFLLRSSFPSWNVQTERVNWWWKLRTTVPGSLALLCSC